jgi:hypothetical protein
MLRAIKARCQASPPTDAHLRACQERDRAIEAVVRHREKWKKRGKRIQHLQNLLTAANGYRIELEERQKYFLQYKDWAERVSAERFELQDKVKKLEAERATAPEGQARAANGEQ